LVVGNKISIGNKKTPQAELEEFLIIHLFVFLRNVQANGMAAGLGFPCW